MDIDWITIGFVKRVIIGIPSHRPILYKSNNCPNDCKTLWSAQNGDGTQVPCFPQNGHRIGVFIKVSIRISVKAPNYMVENKV